MNSSTSQAYRRSPHPNALDTCHLSLTVDRRPSQCKSARHEGLWNGKTPPSLLPIPAPTDAVAAIGRRHLRCRLEPAADADGVKVDIGSEDVPRPNDERLRIR